MKLAKNLQNLGTEAWLCCFGRSKKIRSSRKTNDSLWDWANQILKHPNI